MHEVTIQVDKGGALITQERMKVSRVEPCGCSDAAPCDVAASAAPSRREMRVKEQIERLKTVAVWPEQERGVMRALARGISDAIAEIDPLSAEFGGLEVDMGLASVALEEARDKAIIASTLAAFAERLGCHDATREALSVLTIELEARNKHVNELEAALIAERVAHRETRAKLADAGWSL